MAIGEAPYCQYVGHALQERQRELSLRWLERLVALLPVDANAVFTTSELLDHIPRLIEEIGKYVADPERGRYRCKYGGDGARPGVGTAATSATGLCASGPARIRSAR